MYVGDSGDALFLEYDDCGASQSSGQRRLGFTPKLCLSYVGESHHILL